MIRLVSVYFQVGIKIPTVEKFLSLCKDCEYCQRKLKCSEEIILEEENKNGYIYCDDLGAMLYEIDKENKRNNNR